MNPTIAGIFAIIMWSSAGLLVTLANNIPGFEILGISWAVSFAVLFSYYCIVDHNVFQQLKRPFSDYLFLAGSICGYTLIYYFAFKFSPPFEVNVLNYTWPIFLIIFIDLSERHLPNIRKFCGMMLGFIGSILIVGANPGGQYFQSFGVGHLMVLVAALIWAGYSCCARSKNYPSELMLPVFFISFILFGTGHLVFEQWRQPDVTEWTAIILLGVCNIAFVMWDIAIRKGNRVLVTSLSYFIPLFSTLLMIAGGFGAANAAVAAAAGLIILGCLIVNGDQFRKLFAKK